MACIRCQQGLDMQGQGQGPSLQGPGQGQGLDLQGQGQGLHQWLKWSCVTGGSPDEARLEQTPYPFHTQLIWRYLGIK